MYNSDWLTTAGSLQGPLFSSKKLVSLNRTPEKLILIVNEKYLVYIKPKP